MQMNQNGMQATLGAHEIMEIHEVLTDTINGINQFQLYIPYCRDTELQNILQNQLTFMTNEYNTIVKMIQRKTNSTNLPTMNTTQNFSPTYGIQSSSSNQPNTSMNQMNDKDVASGMLGCAKSSATMRMHAALECSDPEVRNAIVQGAKNCADQAYETWMYMNKKGYYQVPTFDQQTTQSIINGYQQANQTMNQQQNYNM